MNVTIHCGNYPTWVEDRGFENEDWGEDRWG